MTSAAVDKVRSYHRRAIEWHGGAFLPGMPENVDHHYWLGSPHEINKQMDCLELGGFVNGSG